MKLNMSSCCERPSKTCNKIKLARLAHMNTSVRKKIAGTLSVRETPQNISADASAGLLHSADRQHHVQLASTVDLNHLSYQFIKQWMTLVLSKYVLVRRKIFPGHLHWDWGNTCFEAEVRRPEPEGGGEVEESD